MASVKKFTQSAVVNMLRHNARTIENPSNEDIDADKSNLNYALSPYRGQSDYDYFMERKSQLYCYGRNDVKVMAGWIVTAPKDLDKDEYETFFKLSYDFLENRYGRENVIQAVVHNDESGQPHLHFNFIPVVVDKKHGGEKICCNDVLNRKELRSFHPDLNHYLKERGIECSVISGITREQGGNKTVLQLKQERELEIERKIEVEHQYSRGRWQ